MCLQLLRTELCFFKRQFRFRQSIPIDNHTILRHRLVIDYQYQSINCYRLISIIDSIDWAPRDITARLQLITCFKRRTSHELYNFNTRFQLPSSLRAVKYIFNGMYRNSY